MTTKLKDGERLDDLQRNGYQIIQNPNKFCFGMDAVLLSGFARVKKGERALDLGTGTVFPFAAGERRRDGILPGWRSRRRVRIWPDAAWS